MGRASCPDLMENLKDAKFSFSPLAALDLAGEPNQVFHRPERIQLTSTAAA